MVLALQPRRGVDRLVLRARRKPHAAVLLIGAVDGEPRSAQGIRHGGDVVGVLVVALPGAPRELEEEHALHSHDIGPDQRFQYIEHARVQQEAFVDLQDAVQHVDN